MDHRVKARTNTHDEVTIILTRDCSHHLSKQQSPIIRLTQSNGEVSSKGDL